MTYPLPDSINAQPPQRPRPRNLALWAVSAASIVIVLLLTASIVIVARSQDSRAGGTVASSASATAATEASSATPEQTPTETADPVVKSHYDMQPDICLELSWPYLGDLAAEVTLDSQNTEDYPESDELSCFFYGPTSQERDAYVYSVAVRQEVYTTAQGASAQYDKYLESFGQDYESSTQGELSGMGEKAYRVLAEDQDQESQFFGAVQYFVCVLSSNLFLTVNMVGYGDFQKDDLEQRMVSETKEILSLL